MHAGFAHGYSRSQIDRIIQEYSAWLLRLIAEGYRPYFLTFIYRELTGSRSAILAQMRAEVERVYRIMLTRIVRCPNSVPLWQLPLLIASPDLPVPKRGRKRTVALSYVLRNGGLHYHAFVLIPPRSRMRVGLDEHVQKKRHIYVGVESRLINLDVREITYTPGQMVTYGMKTIQHLTLDDADCLIFPKTSGEVLDPYRPGRRRPIEDPPTNSIDLGDQDGRHC